MHVSLINLLIYRGFCSKYRNIFEKLSNFNLFKIFLKIKWFWVVILNSYVGIGFVKLKIPYSYIHTQKIIIYNVYIHK